MNAAKLVIHCYPWYIADWSQSEAVAAMTLEERGLYRELLDLCYANGSIPDDAGAIQKLTRSTEKEVRRAWSRVRGCFYVDPADSQRLRNRRCDRALIEIEKARRKRSNAGAKGAEARWQAEDSKNSNANGNAIPNAQAMPRHTLSHPLPHSLPLPPPPLVPPEPEQPPERRDDGNGRPRYEPFGSDEPDRSKLAKALVARLMASHPKPGNASAAEAQVERLLADAVNPGDSCDEIVKTHARWVAYWRTNPKRFQPMLHRWFGEGDWKQPPAENAATGTEDF